MLAIHSLRNILVVLLIFSLILTAMAEWKLPDLIINHITLTRRNCFKYRCG
uniref:Antibacterial peptide muscin n=1 Tax=Musca domestica TaxID=7370 RepID=V5LVL6_MUSDO|nr:antibacterial peptide muscin [Musca domestica]